MRTMVDKEKIASFIANHNIIRPIEYPLLGLPLFSGISSIVWLMFLVFSPNKYFEERVISYIGMFILICCFILGIISRKKCIKLYNTDPGKSLYCAEILIHSYCVVIALLLMIYFLLLDNELKEAIIIFICGLSIIAITVCITTIAIKRRIEKGLYLKKQNGNYKVIQIFSSGASVVVFILLKNIIINNHDINVSFVISILLLIPAEIASILVVLYYLKLKYAKEYGLEEYLPRRPNPSKYTGWK